MLLGLSTGGIGTHVRDLAADLRELGDEVTVVTDASTAERFQLSGARWWWPGRSSGLIGSLRGLWRLRRLVGGAEVLHAHGHQAGLVAVLVSVGTRTPVVVSQHNAVLVGGPRRRLLDLAQRLVARRATLVTGASSDLVAEAQRLGARDPRLAPVPSPRVPDLLAAEPLAEGDRGPLAAELLRENGIQPSQPGAPLALTIARIAPQKDLETLLEAAAQVAHPDATKPAVWVVVGGGDDHLRVALERRIEAEGLPVHLVGPQPDPDRWLRAADVFVLPSLWEARALVVQEAMAAGVPVVATDTGGLPDLVEGVGTLVPVRDPSRLADAVDQFLRDPAARLTASKQGRERAASWDDGKATASRWHEWYSGMLGMT
ncbi:Glycosyltransferase involved in cell wall bisynthesis [Pedococcus dokdonensis]|uniref:D-inositol 3-phosphate glycosyltransferase n=2 Tax=Pedococcus dokdonensis TaxID=443156 RepID=A0A1H0PMU7_9MICO|nr:Glycosyltransferase involved in cell wall bisynthesis [Pedococcus dokdonensis]